MSDAPNIVVLPGDGIGPEIVAATREMLDTLGEFAYDERLMGGCSIDADGVALTDEVLAACKASDAVLLGAVGDNKFNGLTPDKLLRNADLALYRAKGDGRGFMA